MCYNEEGVNMEYSVTIDKFSGPMDLLVHLIKIHDIDIFDIRISEIADHYLEYIRQMENLELDISSEYLVMASELILMKSKELLPNMEDELEEEKEEFINRIAEYQIYKEVSAEFKKMQQDRSFSFAKEASLLKEFKSDKLLINDDITLELLLKALVKFNEKKQLEKPLNTVVTRKEYSVDKRNKEIMNLLKNKKTMYFDDLFENYNRDYIVVTFLSILDLAKKGLIYLSQEYKNDRILLSKGGC